MNEKRFQKNLDRLGQIQPQLTIEVAQADATHLHFCKTKQGEENLYREVNGKKESFYSGYNAAKEADNWFNTLELSTTEVLYVYGVGLGHYYDAAKKWLKESAARYLVFIEDDLAVVKRFLETEKATEILHDPQVQVHVLKDYITSESMFQWLSWFFVLLPIEVSALQYYKKAKYDEMEKLRGKLLHDSLRKDSLASEFMRFSGGFFQNFYHNLTLLHEAYHGSNLFGKFHGVPGIICGAGPSLNKNIHLLKGLENRAFIFAGGSALNSLNYHGISASFGAGIDPNPPQYDRIIRNYSYELPMFYRGRMFHDALKAIHGPRLYINGTGGYFISEWFEDKMDIEGEIIDEGYNVVNFSVEIAKYLGCNPIIFVGMDLAFSGMQKYASGVIGNSSVDKDKVTAGTGMNTSAFPRRDIYGNEVYTLWKWVTESEWLGSYAKGRPDCTFINATEGGLGFPGVPNMTLEEVRKKYLQGKGPLKDLVHVEVQNSTLKNITSKKVAEASKEMAESLQNCLDLCDKMLEEIEQIKERIESRKKVAPSMQSGKASLYEAELTQEPAYDYILSTMSSACTKILERKLLQIEYDKSLRSEVEKNLARLEVNRTKVSFLRDAGSVNLEILKKSLEAFKNQEEKVAL